MASLYELFVKLSADVSNFKSGTAEAKKGLKEVGESAQSLDDKLGQLAKKWGAGLGLTALGAFAIKSAEKVEEAGFIIRRTTGATGEVLAGLEQTFAAVYRTTSKSADEVAGALSKITIETRATGIALETLVKQNLAYAKVTGGDLKASIEGTQTVFKNWSIATGEQAEALNVLYRVTQETAISSDKLTSQMATAGPIMRTLGFSFQQTAAFIGLLEEKSIPADQVISMLSRTLAKLARDTGDPVSALASLNARIMGAKDGAEALGIVMSLGGRGGAAMVAYIDAVRRGALNFEEFEKLLSKNTDTIEKASKETKGFAQKMTELRHAAELSFAPVGNLFLVMATAIIDWTGPTISALDVLIRKFDELQKKRPGEAWMNVTEAALMAAASAYGARPQTGGAPKSAKSAPSIAPPAIVIPTDKELKQYAKALQEALELFGLSDKKAIELNKSLGVLNKEFQAGRLTTEQYSAALTKYWQDLAKTITTSAETTVAVLAQEKAQLSLSAAMDKMVSVVVKMQDASKPWGTQLEYHRAKLDELTTSLHGAYLELQAITTKQLEVDWSKVSKGTTLEVALDPNSSIGLRRAADAAADEALRIRDLWQQGKATQRDWEMAQQRAEEAERRATGTTKEHSRAISAQASAAKEVDREVRRAFDNMARGIARNIIEWKGWGDTLKNVVKNLAEGLLEIFIRQLFKPLEDIIAGIGKSLTEKLTGKATDTLGGGGGGGGGGLGGGGGGGGFGGMLGGDLLGFGYQFGKDIVMGPAEGHLAIIRYLAELEFKTFWAWMPNAFTYLDASITGAIGKVVASVESLHRDLVTQGGLLVRLAGATSVTLPMAPALATIPSNAASMISPVGDVVTININGLDASGAPVEALELFRQGARLLRAKGVRSSVGIR